MKDPIEQAIDLVEKFEPLSALGLGVDKDFRVYRLKKPGQHGYTAFVSFGAGGVEEIDVRADDRIDATEIARIVLNRQYQPGGKIMRVVQRF